MCGELYFLHITYSREEGDFAGPCVFFIEFSELVFQQSSVIIRLFCSVAELLSVNI